MNKTQTQNTRVIEVKRCAVGYCPHCIPDSSRKSINYCGAFRTPKEIEARVKTFPKICPLKSKAK